MPVPVTAVDEDAQLTTSEYQIRAAREIISMKVVPRPEGMGAAAHDHLRSGVLLSNGAHDGASTFRSHGISHHAMCLMMSSTFETCGERSRYS